MTGLHVAENVVTQPAELVASVWSCLYIFSASAMSA